AIVLLVYWSVGLARIHRSLKALPSARDGAASARERPCTEPVCVIVPAHNEAGVIGELVASLRQQTHPAVRFVLALDRCTDDTLKIVRELTEGDDRFEIIEIAECPEAWAGKVNAVWTAFRASDAAKNASHLICADADTIFDPELVAASCALVRDRQLDMLSYVSDLSARSWFEKIVQPACGVELLYQYPILRANGSGEHRRAFANGQFMLFTRDAYEKLGGHEAVSEAVLEDMALARIAADLDLRVGIFMSDRMLRVRMYDRWDAFRTGWKRIYIDCAKRKLSRLHRYAWRVRWIGTVLPACAFAGVLLSIIPTAAPEFVRWIAGGLCALGLCAWLLAMGYIYRRGGFPLWSVPLNPIANWLLGGLFSEAARDLESGRPVKWGGRSYLLEPR
ncbi:MAG: glycosyltransferase, partial [Phycisphaerales bacterium]